MSSIPNRKAMTSARYGLRQWKLNERGKELFNRMPKNRIVVVSPHTPTEQLNHFLKLIKYPSPAIICTDRQDFLNKTDPKKLNNPEDKLIILQVMSDEKFVNLGIDEEFLFQNPELKRRVSLNFKVLDWNFVYDEVAIKSVFVYLRNLISYNSNDDNLNDELIELAYEPKQPVEEEGIAAGNFPFYVVVYSPEGLAASKQEELEKDLVNELELDFAPTFCHNLKQIPWGSYDPGIKILLINIGQQVEDYLSMQNSLFAYLHVSKVEYLLLQGDSSYAEENFYWIRNAFYNYQESFSEAKPLTRVESKIEPVLEIGYQQLYSNRKELLRQSLPSSNNSAKTATPKKQPATEIANKPLTLRSTSFYSQLMPNSAANLIGKGYQPWLTIVGGPTEQISEGVKSHLQKLAQEYTGSPNNISFFPDYAVLKSQLASHPNIIVYMVSFKPISEPLPEDLNFGFCLTINEWQQLLDPTFQQTMFNFAHLSSNGFLKNVANFNSSL